MNKVIFSVITVSWVSILVAPVSAYELATHGTLTYKAYQRSVLVDTDLVEILGIENGESPFGNKYYDVDSMNGILERRKERNQDSFENLFMVEKLKDSLGIIEARSIEGWLLTGAIREDDITDPDNGQPVNDPHSENANLERPLYHFYDPVDPLNRGSALFVSCIGFGYNCVRRYAPDLRSAPDWAIGTRDAFTALNTPESARRNHFTVFDAREAMYRALTGRSKDGTLKAETEAARDAYWATTFRALGDIVHLVEDMAQPQHTRNDPRVTSANPSWKITGKRINNA